MSDEPRTTPCPHCDRLFRHGGEVAHHIAVTHPGDSSNPDRARARAGTGL